MRSSFTCRVVSLAATLALAALMPAVSQAQTMKENAEQLVANGHTEVFHGAKQADGACVSGIQLRGEPGQPPQVAAELSVEPATCTETYLVGTPSGDQTVNAAEAERGAGHYATGHATAGPSASASSRRAHASRERHKLTAHAASSYRQAYFITTINAEKNGAWIKQMWVKSVIQWHYNGSCVVSPAPTGVVEEEWWEPWGRGTNDDPIGWECEKAYQARGVDYGNRNNSCGGENSWIHIWRNTIDGYSNGGYVGWPGDSWCDNNVALQHVYRVGEQ